MNTAQLNPGDRVEINRKGLVFTATLDTPVPAGWLIRDTKPAVGYMHASPRQIVKKLESGVAG